MYSEINSTYCLTINTDASFCGRTKASGYAVYARCGTFFLKSAGNFNRRKPKNISEAELFAICNAVSLCISSVDLVSTSVIVINCDCKSVINNIKKNKALKEVQLAIRLINELKYSKRATKVELRHVKAHSKTEDKRSHVNRWCDRNAKEMMRAERRSILAKI